MLPSRKQRDITEEADLWNRTTTIRRRRHASTIRRRRESTMSAGSIKSYKEEDNEIIRSMPVSMARKREMRLVFV